MTTVFKKPFAWVTALIMIVLLAASAIFLLRTSPRFSTAPIASVLIGNDWKTTFTNYIRISGNDVTCQPDDGKEWACQVMVEGKPLEMTVSYSNQSLTGCSVSYGGQAVACEATLGNGWQANLLIDSDLGISPARMAELRSQNLLLYMNESTWLLLGVAFAAVIAFLLTLMLLGALNKKTVANLFIPQIRLPVWALSLVTIVAASIVSRATGMLLLLPLGVGGSLILGVVIVWFNNLHKKRAVAFAHPAMWAAASLAIFWGVNLVTAFSLLIVGVVD
ncbi:MAG: hypothetical protein R3E39_10635 [Anaerolineae bacterium]